MGDSELKPGQVLAGKFRILQVLGQGAMGMVVAARHLHLDEDVAIKVLLPDALKSSEAVRRFEREARAAAKIRSEHVARVIDVGQLDSGAPYMVMEHLTGVDLKQYLETHGPLSLEETVHYLLQACEALAEAHKIGIVHRDLKPANLFRIVRADGSPSIKILDFGISKVQGTDVSMTSTSMMMGSPFYMSPEQMTSAKDVDARTDIWALGVILQQLLTGKVPFYGESVFEVCSQVLQEKAPPLSQSRADLPKQLQDVLDKALAKDREKRFSNVAEFSHELGAFGDDVDQRGVDRIGRVLGTGPMPVFPKRQTDSGDTQAAPEYVSEIVGDGTFEGSAQSFAPYKPPTRRSPLPLALGSLALLGLGIFLLASRLDDSDPAVEKSIEGAASPVSALENSPLPAAQRGQAEPHDAAPPYNKVGAQKVSATEASEVDASEAGPGEAQRKEAEQTKRPESKKIAAATSSPGASTPQPPPPAPSPASQQASPTKAPADYYLDRQ